MASWEDGPEYAPLERPSGFVGPAAPPLTVAAPRAKPNREPLGKPVFEQRQAVRPLPDIGAKPPPGRDPAEAFAVARAAVTGAVSAPPGGSAYPAESAWGAVHTTAMGGWAAPSGPPVVTAPATNLPAHPAPGAPGSTPLAPGAAASPHLPAQPQVQHGGGPGQTPYPAPGSPQWFGPGPVRPTGPANRLTLGNFITGMDPWVLGALFAGAVVMPVSPLMFLLAMLFSGRTQYRRTWVRNTFWLGAATMVTALLLGVALSAGDFELWYDMMSKVSWLVCLGVLATVAVLVSLALTNNEMPESDHEPTQTRG